MKDPVPSLDPEQRLRDAIAEAASFLEQSQRRMESLRRMASDNAALARRVEEFERVLTQARDSLERIRGAP